MEVKVRFADIHDVEELNVLHFYLNRHRHQLQPRNFQGKSMGEDWIKEKLAQEEVAYLVLEVDQQVKGMALVEVVEDYSIPGNVRYRYLQIEDFIIDEVLELQTYGPILFRGIREYGRQKRLSHIQLNELANDEEKISFFKGQSLLAIQQTLKCVI